MKSITFLFLGRIRGCAHQPLPFSNTDPAAMPLSSALAKISGSDSTTLRLRCNRIAEIDDFIDPHHTENSTCGRTQPAQPQDRGHLGECETAYKHHGSAIRTWKLLEGLSNVVVQKVRSVELRGKRQIRGFQSNGLVFASTTRKGPIQAGQFGQISALVLIWDARRGCLSTAGAASSLPVRGRVLFLKKPCVEHPTCAPS